MVPKNAVVTVPRAAATHRPKLFVRQADVEINCCARGFWQQTGVADFFLLAQNDAASSRPGFDKLSPEGPGLNGGKHVGP